MRRFLPFVRIVFTFSTFTLNADSTAARMSSLVALRSTSNANTFADSCIRVVFSVINGFLRMYNGSLITPPPRPLRPT